MKEVYADRRGKVKKTARANLFSSDFTNTLAFYFYADYNSFMDIKNKSLLTMDEAAALLDVSRPTLYTLMRDGEIKPTVTSGLRNKRRLFSKADVIALKKKYAN